MQDLTAPVLAGLGSALVVLGIYHFVVAGPSLRKARAAAGTRDAGRGGDGDAAPGFERELEGLAKRIAALEKVAQRETPRIGFLRYNAFDDVGSDQSYALALLSKDGDGVVLSSIYSREETRTYGKGVLKFQTAQEASAEELAAIAKARGRGHVTRSAFGIIALGLVLLAAGALGFHAWQFQLAEDRVAALQKQAAAQSAQLRAINRQAESLAGQLRDIQRQDDAIRKLLGVGAPPAQQPRRHVAVPAGAPPSAAQIQARLERLAGASQQRLAQGRVYARLAQRVLNLRVATTARARLIAALPSLNPVAGAIAAGFGWRIDPWPEFHRGLDLAADYGTPVHAAADGVIAAAGWDGGFGLKVDVNHENGYHTWYAHLSRLAVAPGRRVRKGEVIAFAGATGDATGPHLHYQVMLGGQAIDPSPYLAGVPARVLATLPSLERVQ